MFVQKYINLIALIVVTFLVFKYVDGAYELFRKNEEFIVTKGNLLKTFPIFPIEYKVTFEVLISSISDVDSQCSCVNLFRFTNGSDDLKRYGNRILSLYITSPVLRVFHYFSINGIIDEADNSLLNTGWKKFNFSQFFIDGDYKFTLNIDGQTILSKKNDDARVFYNVGVFFSDPFYVPLPARVRNFLVTKGCSDVNSYCKPNLNVQINWLMIENVLNISFQVTYNNIEDLAYNVLWEYFLPPFVTLQSEITPLDAVKFDDNSLKYKISKLQSNGTSQNITVLVNNYKCFYGDSFNIEIPFKLYFENSAASSWNSFQVIRNSLKEDCKSFRLPIDQNHATEYYGRGLYWDDISSQIYLCINQYVTSLEQIYHSCST
ncbi:uncharacterized protein LOC105847539 [Hydra vulgaris]|uniref:uncharacterized protein LOC105847539 n=1 Tax=Hydra vulgaris TaxID=6087 RepID=UPI0032EA331A